MLTDKKIAVLVDDYFEQVELVEPMEVLKAAGARVDIIAVDKRKIRGLNHIEKGDSFQADELLENVDSEEYDAVMLPGGVVNSDHLRIKIPAQEFVQELFEAGKPVAAICHAPWLLVSAGIAEGKSLTSYPTLQDDIRNAGGNWLDKEVVIDANLITSRNPDDIPAFAKAIIKALSD